MCILLKRLAYPCRLSDLSEFFGLSPQSLSSIINEIVNIIMNRLGRLLDNLENVQFLTREKMEYYAQVYTYIYILAFISILSNIVTNAFDI